jgi:hypothetical protein
MQIIIHDYPQEPETLNLTARYNYMRREENGIITAGKVL